MNTARFSTTHAGLARRALRPLIATSLLAALALGVTTPTLGGEEADLPHRQVSFADLDLTRSADAAVLYGRIRVAAEHVCKTHVAGGVDLLMRERVCIEFAVARAVRQVNRESLTAVYRDHESRVRPVRLATLQQG